MLHSHTAWQQVISQLTESTDHPWCHSNASPESPAFSNHLHWVLALDCTKLPLLRECQAWLSLTKMVSGTLGGPATKGLRWTTSTWKAVEAPPAWGDEKVSPQ